jgi:type VI secretion system protein ImpL
LARVIVLVLVWSPLGAWLVWRRVRAIQASRAIERALAEQASQQAMGVAPDRRDQIAALTEEMNRALTALRRSRVGRQKSGGAALYALPWYVIVGPPAAGKSTALLASGLSFPYSAAGGKGVRGVGGTRNCDWWFAREAILLDTAGRYITESDDREEWLAFLHLLRKHRPRKPLNGVLVALPITEIADADPDQLDEMAARLRERIDEIMSELGLVLPAYVLLTKCDLLPGFIETFGELGKRERGQIFGFTLSLDESRPAEVAMGAELDVLMDRLRGRTLSRLGGARQPDEGELVFQFPLQLASARRNLLRLMGQLFEANPYQESPIFRGAYFTSGTQEGRPIDRALGEMSRAFGLPERPAGQLAAESRAERKSYFLHQLFTEVIFPDRFVAARPEGEVARRRRLGLIIAAASGGLGALVAIGGLVSARGNGRLTDEALTAAKQAAAVPWDAPDRTAEDFAKLGELRAQLAQLEKWRAAGPPLSLGLGMFVGRDLEPGLRAAYAGQLERVLVAPAVRELSLRTGAPYAPDRAGAEQTRFAALKALLMLSEPKHVDDEFLVAQLLPIWRDELVQRHSLVADVVLTPHLRQLAREIASGGIPPRRRDEPLIEQARSALRRTPEGDAALRVLTAEAQKRLQPVELRDALDGLVQTVLTSRATVPGCYTRTGWEQFVRRELADAHGKADRDGWVLTDQTNANADQEAQAGLRARYFEEYAAAWKKFLRGLSVRASDNPRDALRDLETLTQENPPYARLLKQVIAQTSIPADGATAQAAQGAIDKLRSKITGDPGAAPNPPQYMPPLDVEFAKLREFVQGTGKGEPPLTQYLAELGKLRDAMRDMVESGGDSQKVADEARAANDLTKRLMLETLDDRTRVIVRDLFEQPIALAGGSAIRGSGESLSRAWSEEVFGTYQKSIAGRYPFVRGGSDATLADATEFFKEGGVVWGFYQAKLAKLAPRAGDNFHPEKSYERVFGGGFLKCLHDAAVWSAALFPPGAQAPQMSFEVRPQPVGRGVSEVTLEIDGVSRTYRNGPEERWPFTWPGTGKVHGVRLSTKGAAGPIDQIAFPGEWGLLHFFDAGKLAKSSGGVFALVLPLKSGAQVRIDIRPSRSRSPITDRPTLACPQGVK